jgi:hypothetical protein
MNSRRIVTVMLLAFWLFLGPVGMASPVAPDGRL